MKLTKTIKNKNFKLVSNNAWANFQKRYYASDDHDVHLYKTDIQISEAYLDKWGFLTDEQWDEYEKEIDRDFEEIRVKYDKIREDKINSWTVAELYPWYTEAQLNERKETIIEMKRLVQESIEEYETRMANQKPLPFTPTYENTFGETSKPILWKRYFKQNGNKAPPEPKATIRVTTDAPFDTTKWDFYTNPVHCARFLRSEYGRLHPTRQLWLKYLNESDPKKFGPMRAELDELIPMQHNYFTMNGIPVHYDPRTIEFPEHY